MSRFNDPDDAVREVMVRFAGDVLVLRPEADVIAGPTPFGGARAEGGVITNHLMQILKAKSPALRMLAVEQICAAAAKRLDAVEAILLRRVGDRLCDLKVEVRVAVTTGLSRVFERHVSQPLAQWVDGADGGADAKKQKRRRRGGRAGGGGEMS